MGQNSPVDEATAALPPQAGTASQIVIKDHLLSPGSATKSKHPRSEEVTPIDATNVPLTQGMVKPNEHCHTHLRLTLSPDWLHTIDLLMKDLRSILKRQFMKDRMYPDVGIFTLPENLQVLQIHEVPDCSRQQLNHHLTATAWDVSCLRISNSSCNL